MIVVMENLVCIMEEEGLPPREAAKKAMGQITGPILAITLVLLSVFLPVAFIPGITGQLFQQFAAVVACSMLISATNALTLSPALCAILLKPTHDRRGIMGYVMRRIDGMRDGYAYVVARLVRVALLVVVAVAGAGLAAGWLFQVTPTGFLPEEDQGAFMAEIQLPQGASLNRTEDITRQVEEIVKADPAIEWVLTLPGYSILDGAIEPNAAFVLGRLKPFEERTPAELKVDAVIQRVAAKSAGIPSVRVTPFNLPSIIGLGTSGGFEYQLEGLLRRRLPHPHTQQRRRDRARARDHGARAAARFPAAAALQQLPQRYGPGGPAPGRSSGDAPLAMEERASGKSILDAAINGATLRIRAVLMTIFAFILGLVPLVIASGAGEASQRGVGTAVFGGMLVASSVGVFPIPMLYLVFQRLREWFHGGATNRKSAPEAPAEVEG